MNHPWLYCTVVGVEAQTSHGSYRCTRYGGGERCRISHNERIYSTKIFLVAHSNESGVDAINFGYRLDKLGFSEVLASVSTFGG